jgi:monooxygenase
MYTLGYRSSRGRDDTAIADGPAILDYVRETAREYGVDAHPLRPPGDGGPSGRLRRRALDGGGRAPGGRAASRSPAASCGVQRLLRLRRGLHARASRASSASGPLVHPQHWPEDLDYAASGRGDRQRRDRGDAGAGDGRDAAHVTMLQRSPTYIVSLPAEDGSPSCCAACCRAGAYALTRWKNVLLARGSTSSAGAARVHARGDPQTGVRSCFRPGYDVDTHFKPRYNPWDQRLCLVPDGDLFRRLRSGTAEIVTDRSTRSPRPACGWSRAASSRPTSSSPRPG